MIDICAAGAGGDGTREYGGARGIGRMPSQSIKSPTGQTQISINPSPYPFLISNRTHLVLSFTLLLVVLFERKNRYHHELILCERKGIADGFEGER